MDKQQKRAAATIWGTLGAATVGSLAMVGLYGAEVQSNYNNTARIMTSLPAAEMSGAFAYHELTGTQLSSNQREVRDGLNEISSSAKGTKSFDEQIVEAKLAGFEGAKEGRWTLAQLEQSGKELITRDESLRDVNTRAVSAFMERGLGEDDAKSLTARMLAAEIIRPDVDINAHSVLKNSPLLAQDSKQGLSEYADAMRDDLVKIGLIGADRQADRSSERVSGFKPTMGQANPSALLGPFDQDLAAKLDEKFSDKATVSSADLTGPFDQDLSNRMRSDEAQQRGTEIDLNGSQARVAFEAAGKGMELGSAQTEVTLDHARKDIALEPSRQDVAFEDARQGITFDPDRKEITLQPSRQEIDLGPASQDDAIGTARQDVAVEGARQGITLDTERKEITLNPVRKEITLNPARKEIVLSDVPATAPQAATSPENLYESYMKQRSGQSAEATSDASQATAVSAEAARQERIKARAADFVASQTPQIPAPRAAADRGVDR